MASKVTICNLALARIGDEANITSIDPPEGSAMAEACQRLYPLAVEVVLEAHDWTFAMRRRALAKLSSVETGGWKYGFKVPSDALRVVAVRDQKFQSGRHAPVPLGNASAPTVPSAANACRPEPSYMRSGTSMPNRRIDSFKTRATCSDRRRRMARTVPSLSLSIEWSW